LYFRYVWIIFQIIVWYMKSCCGKFERIYFSIQLFTKLQHRVFGILYLLWIFYWKFWILLFFLHYAVNLLRQDFNWNKGWLLLRRHWNISRIWWLRFHQFHFRCLRSFNLFNFFLIICRLFIIVIEWHLRLSWILWTHWSYRL